jgi:eukaryotic-like serine/threonine-protein kinase
VLFEMLTGKRAFPGATAPDALEAVVKFDPDWTALPAGTPVYLRRLLERMLAKDRKERLQAIGEARIALEKTGWAEVSLQTEARSVSKSPWVTMAAAVVLALALAALAFVHFREKPPVEEMVRFEVSAPANTIFGNAAVSPDDRQMAFVVSSGEQSQIFIRALGETKPRPLAGTEGADSVVWSSDSRTVAFVADQKLKRLDIAGGATQTIGDIAGWAADKGAPSASSGSRSWNPNGVLLIPHGAIFRVSASGGSLEPVTKLDSARGEIMHAYPEFLPDNRHFLFVAAGQRHEDSALWVGSLDSPRRTRVASVDANVSFVSRRPGSEQGYLVHGKNSTLVAQPFDAAKLRTTGEASPITEGVDYVNAAPGTLYRTQFSVSAMGAVLAYSPPRRRNSQLVWFDRTGHRLGAIGPSAVFNNVSLASDGKRIALDPLDTTTNRSTLAPMDIWTIDSVRGTYSRLTFENATNWFPCFSPDGNRLAFTSNRAGRPHLYIKSSTGAGRESVC